MIRLTDKSTGFNCHFQNKRPNRQLKDRCLLGQESHCHLIKTTVEILLPQLIYKNTIAFCLIAVLCLSSTGSRGDDSPDSKSPFEKKPTTKSPFDKKPTTTSPFDKKPTTKSPFDKKPTTKSSLDKQPLKSEPSIERVKKLETSDGVPLELAYYPPKGKSLATVLLVHDLDGSEKTLRRLALGLQESGCAVVVPDLRGHGGSKSDLLDLDISKKKLLSNQIRMIPASGGGRIRRTARIKGDLETVRMWLEEKGAEDGPNLDQLCVIGSGLGGTLAAIWTAADWNWIPNTKGPQGQQVRALILISPVWSGPGISITNALNARTTFNELEVKPLLERLPVMIIAGSNDRQSSQLFHRLKGARPTSWFMESENGMPQQSKKHALPNQMKTGILKFQELPTSLRADKLASLPSGDRTPLQLCISFISEIMSDLD